MSGLPSPTISSVDLARVRVMAGGLLQAISATTEVPTFVIANLAVDSNPPHADTAFINITDNPPPLALDSISIHPLPGDSTVLASSKESSLDGVLAYVGINVSPVLRARTTDVAGNAIPGLVVEYASLDPEVAQVDWQSGAVHGLKVGQARLVTRTVAYGVIKADTVTFTVTNPVSQRIAIDKDSNGTISFNQTDVTLQPNGYVFWWNGSGQPVDVTFDNPTDVAEADVLCPLFTSLGSPNASCSAGDIAAFYDSTNSAGNFRVRKFPAPGVYTYHTATGATGRITVRDSRTSTAVRRVGK